MLNIASFSLFISFIFQDFYDIGTEGCWTKRSYSIFDGAGMSSSSSLHLDDMSVCVFMWCFWYMIIMQFLLNFSRSLTSF